MNATQQTEPGTTTAEKYTSLAANYAAAQKRGTLEDEDTDALPPWFKDIRLEESRENDLMTLLIQSASISGPGLQAEIVKAIYRAGVALCITIEKGLAAQH